MTERWSLLPEPITESQLLQLDIGDEFYEVDVGNKGKFVMTKVAERNDADLGWRFEGKMIELNDADFSDKDVNVPFFISDGAGFDYATVCLSPKYYEEEKSDKI